MADRETYFQRAPHSKENPYAQISRELLRDESISFECRGLLGYLLSMRDDFKIKFKHIQNHIKPHTGRDSLRKIVNEAIDAGYIKREDSRDGNLNHGCIYFVSEEPIFKKCLRRTDFQGTENQGAENQSLLEYSSSSNEEEEIEEREKEAPQAPPPAPAFFISGKVKMPEEKAKKLIDTYGKPMFDKYVSDLNDYAEINPARFEDYGCHGTVIRRWLQKDRVPVVVKHVPRTPDQEKNDRESREILFAQPPPPKPTHPNRLWIDNHSRVFRAIRLNKLNLRTDHVLIVETNEKILYDQHGFQETMENYFRKFQ